MTPPAEATQPPTVPTDPRALLEVWPAAAAARAALNQRWEQAVRELGFAPGWGGYELTLNDAERLAAQLRAVDTAVTAVTAIADRHRVVHVVYGHPPLHVIRWRSDGHRHQVEARTLATAWRKAARKANQLTRPRARADQ